MKIWISNYDIHSPWHGQSHPGALIRLEWNSDQIGYSDLHPWPHLGDPMLEELVRQLTQFRVQILSHLKQRSNLINECANEISGVFNSLNIHSLLKRSLRLNFEDAIARSEGKDLLIARPIPLSHHLIEDHTKLKQEVEQKQKQGFDFFKLKLGQNLISETQSLIRLGEPGAILRLDFNSKCSMPEFMSWWESLSFKIQAQIRGIEDPCFLGPDDSLDDFKIWMSQKNSLYLIEDRYSKLNLNSIILKPEIEEPDQFIHCHQNSSLSSFANQTSKVIAWMTNNLGHPLGHRVALSYASRFRPNQVGGLQGLDRYQGFEIWKEEIQYRGPQTFVSPGKGFGFDALLEKQDWKQV